MRRALTVIGVTALLALAACSSGSDGGTGTGGDTPNTTAVPTAGSGGNSITDPVEKARSVVEQQNAQLRQEEQRTGYEDPTYP